MAKIRVCDRCGETGPGSPVRGYRWMRLMSNDDYKHKMLVKVDLCDICHQDVLRTLKDVLFKK